VLVASLPSLLSTPIRRLDAPGARFDLALDILQQLHTARQSGLRGCEFQALARDLRVDPLDLEEVLETLQALDWVGEVAQDPHPTGRWVLLVETADTSVQPLVEALLLSTGGRGAGLMQRCAGLTVGELLTTA
jgi:membrane protein